LAGYYKGDVGRQKLAQKNAMKLAYRHIFALAAGKDTVIQREKTDKTFECISCKRAV